MRLIDADALIAEGWVLERHGVSNKLLTVKSIADVPTIDPDSLRPKGRWIVKTLVGTELLLPHCSECDKPHAREWNFCNECGADMREENDGNN